MTMQLNRSTGMPPGWEICKTGECVAYKFLEDFKYVEIRYEPGEGHFYGYDYIVYVVDRDGPQTEDRKSSHDDLHKAFSAAERL